MNKAATELLISLHPQLYGPLGFFACGDGWYSILDALGTAIESIVALEKRKIEFKEGETVKFGDLIAISDIKEKYGTLRVYFSSSIAGAMLDDLVDLAEEVSQYTCEYCGEAGKIRDVSGWRTCMCDKCHTFREKGK